MPATYNAVPQHTWASFHTLMDKLSAGLGDMEKACKFCGLNSGHYAGLRKNDYQITVPVAKKILAGYKKFKEQKASI